MFKKMKNKNKAAARTVNKQVKAAGKKGAKVSVNKMPTKRLASLTISKPKQPLGATKSQAKKVISSGAEKATKNSSMGSIVSDYNKGANKAAKTVGRKIKGNYSNKGYKITESTPKKAKVTGYKTKTVTP
jgi:hypothetical protein